MREIKFRAWDGMRFHYWGFVSASKTLKELIFVSPHNFNPPLAWEEVQKKCQQYTGLKDKNNKEIYEGGVYKSYTRNVDGFIQIIFEDGQFKGQYGNNDSNLKYILNPNEAKELEEKGNIYENPELIKK